MKSSAQRSSNRLAKKICLLCALAPLLIFLAVGLRLRWFSTRGTILTGTAAQPLFRQCSRSSPVGVSSDRVPSVWEIVNLENSLPKYLARQKGEVGKIKASQFYFQYAGFWRGNRKFVYASAMPLRDFTQYDFTNRVAGYMICDGGPQYFGFEYESATNQFSQLSFNGPQMLR